MKRWGVKQLFLTIALSAGAWGVIAIVCMFVGSTSIGWPRGNFVYRREVVLLASLVGAALAAAGVTYQAILRNPLADPYLLGVSSGAALFAYLWRLPLIAGALMTAGIAAQVATEQVFAFAGAMVAVSLVLLVASRRGRIEPVTLLLTGVIVNSINASIFLLVYYLTAALPASGGPLQFLVGGINTTLTPQEQTTAAVIVAVGWILLLYISGQLNVAGLGEGEAESLGVRIHRLRWIGLIIASLITASAVAISGPIGFVGLICPHLARLLVGHDQRKVLPVATALGAGLLAVADAASRRLGSEGLAETVLPVGVLTSLLGGPFFLLLLWQNRRRTLPEVAS